GGGGMPAPGAASLLPQAETATAISEASASTASEVRTGARGARPPGAPERTVPGKTGEGRERACLAFIGGRFPGWDWTGGRRDGRAGCARHADSVLAAGRAGAPALAMAMARAGGDRAPRRARAAAGRPRGPGGGRRGRVGRAPVWRSSGGGFLVGIGLGGAGTVEQGARVMPTACWQQVAPALRFLRWRWGGRGAIARRAGRGRPRG